LHRFVRWGIRWFVCASVIIGAAVAASPQDRSPKTLYENARELSRSGDWEKAIAAYREVLAIDPDYIPALDDLAWIVATTPDERLRNPTEAERLAARLVNLTHFKLRRSTGTEFSAAYKVHTAHTLAAAFAAKGDFTSAVECALSSVETAEHLSLSHPAAAELLTESRKYLELYREKRPFVAPKGFRRTPVDVH
jgi:tetratricopeptide (TPR) repeat protein